MDRLIFTAASGMTAAMTQQRVVASNLANSQTIGFRAETLDSTPMTLDGPQIEVRSMNATQVHGALMTPGSVVSTGRALDVAMTGDTMLTLQTPDGGEGYTRRGDLSVSATGIIQNGDGLPVVGENGPISVEPGANVSIAQDGGVMVTDPSKPEDPPSQVDKLKLVSTTGTKITKDLTGLFRAPAKGVLPTDDDAQVMVGSLEQSNVKPTEVLVQMVEAQRSFDIRTKLISTARDLDEGGASLMRISAS
jgi:flagellar basal-body rod protein FlgF